MLDWCREQIMLRLDSGCDLDEIETELIDSPPGLSDDERAALWLFAWSYRHSPARRTPAVEEALAR